MPARSPNAHLRVLVVGGVHGDELSSTSLVLHWIRAAMETPSNIHWRFVPLMNPDGMLLASPKRTKFADASAGVMSKPTHTFFFRHAP